MARQKAQQDSVEVNKASGIDDISRFRLGEIGSTGIPIFNGVTQDQIRKELNHPESIKTYKLMTMHPSVNAPLTLYSNMVSKVKYRFVDPKDATEEEKKQTEIVESMFGDMEHSLEDFVAEAMTCTTYGWSVCEKVFRKRTKASGSLYDDGLIGIKKLPLRAHESIEKFVFDDTGNEILAVKQNLTNAYDPYGRFSMRKETDVVIPRSKFLLITLGSNRTNPYGTSPLRNVYSSWRYLQALEELEACSVTKDVNGLPILSIPPQYLSADADPAQKLILENFKNILRNLQQGSQSAIILPNAYDPDTRQPLFKMELLTQDGKKNFSIDTIRQYYRDMIFVGLGADILLMGVSATGSFSMGTLKNTQASDFAQSFLNRIVNSLNDDLIKQLYLLNGWNPARRCKIDYEGFESESLDEIGKFVQRTAAVGMMAQDLDTINFVRNALGIDALPLGTNLDEILPDKTSRSGDGMTSGLSSGVGDTAGMQDDSSSNTENTA